MGEGDADFYRMDFANQGVIMRRKYKEKTDDE